MPLNLPIFLTWCRIVAILFLVGIYYLPEPWLAMSARNVFASLIFILAALTDWLDGFLARRLNQTSAFGAFLDPVADKLMVATTLILLLELGRCDAILALVIIWREITISALREWMAKVGKSKSVAVSMIGKIKTSAQMIALPLLLYAAPIFGINTLFCGKVLLALAAFLTLWSMFYYLSKALPALRE